MDLAVVDHEFQKGGRKNFELWRDSFFEERSAHYNDYISKPLLSQYGCSRLSPYIAFGVCSIREVYQLAMHYVQRSSKKQLSAFISRLRWQSHFIQKFESEPRMEFEAVNKGFLNLPYAYNPDYVTAWKNGQTGFPLVDAALRCVVATGYLNFRMRAMVTSFLTHHLFQHFTTGSAWLARQFLDFEPGIHYGQFQMQAGLTGTNTVRVYNPVKNAMDHDPEAKFIKQWIPALTALPVQFAIAPWEMTPMEEQMYGVKLGEDYPHRIVDLKKSRAYALGQLYGNRKTKTASLERLRILEKHTIRKPSERDDAKQI
ncbi:MAG: FAD-binding domain-containing protein, partial [Leeuwenhoekiella sp.]